MTVDERAWHDAFEALAAAIGREEAATLVARWSEEPATRDDVRSLDAKVDRVEQRLDAKIDQVEQRLDAKIDQVEQRLDAKIDQVEQRLDAKIEMVRADLGARIESSEHRVIAAMRGELNAQVRSMLFGFVGLQVAIGSFVIGLLRFSL